jgi:hypothetical protein
VLTLDIGASAVADGGHLSTTATGVVPTALVKNLAEAGNRSVTVTTFSANGQATTTRIGNTGLAQYYARMAGGCGKTRNAALTSSGKASEPGR